MTEVHLAFNVDKETVLCLGFLLVRKKIKLGKTECETNSYLVTCM